MTTTDETLRLFVAIYVEALTVEPHRATAAAAETCGISRATAIRRLAAARERGMLPPADTPHRPAHARWTKSVTGEAAPSWIACLTCHHPWPCRQADSRFRVDVEPPTDPLLRLNEQQVQVDAQVGATYMTLSANKVAWTVSLGDLVNIDVDEDGAAVGIEVLLNLMSFDFTGTGETPEQDGVITAQFLTAPPHPGVPRERGASRPDRGELGHDQ